MRNRFFFVIFFFFFSSNLYAENLKIQSKNISIEKDNKVSVFKGEVLVKTEDGNTINSDYAKYNKELGFIELRTNVQAKDKKNNIIKAEYAEYNEATKILKTKGPTTITTSCTNAITAAPANID